MIAAGRVSDVYAERRVWNNEIGVKNRPNGFPNKAPASLGVSNYLFERRFGARGMSKCLKPPETIKRNPKTAKRGKWRLPRVACHDQPSNSAWWINQVKQK